MNWQSAARLQSSMHAPGEGTRPTDPWLVLNERALSSLVAKAAKSGWDGAFPSLDVYPPFSYPRERQATAAGSDDASVATQTPRGDGGWKTHASLSLRSQSSSASIQWHPRVAYATCRCKSARFQGTPRAPFSLRTPPRKQTCIADVVG
jgi:hypothetical protein